MNYAYGEGWLKDDRNDECNREQYGVWLLQDILYGDLVHRYSLFETDLVECD